MQFPAAGKVVLYRLTAVDAAQIIERRIAHPCVSGCFPRPGDIVPMHIVRVLANQRVNGQAILDGNDALWVAQASEGAGPGMWEFNRE